MLEASLDDHGEALEEGSPEAVSVEGLSEEEAAEKARQKAAMKAARRNVETGRFVVPSHWPRWAKRCGAKKKGKPDCNSWAVVGMPRCKFHGCGGKRNRELGQIRYLAWVALGAPDTLIKEASAQDITRLALAMFAEYMFNEKNNVPVEARIKAAMWLTEMDR